MLVMTSIKKNARAIFADSRGHKKYTILYVPHYSWGNTPLLYVGVTMDQTLPNFRNFVEGRARQTSLHHGCCMDQLHVCVMATGPQVINCMMHVSWLLDPVSITIPTVHGAGYVISSTRRANYR